MSNVKQTLLLVDDSPNNIELLFDILQDRYDVFFAMSGEKALEISLTKKLDLILLDVVMPEMSGFEVCKQLKSNVNTQNIPIIFLTSKTDIADISKGFEIGAVDYVTKPFHSLELLLRVDTHLCLQQQQQILVQKNQALIQLNEQLETEIKRREAVETALENADARLSLLSEQETKRWGITAFVGQSQQILNVLNEIRRLHKTDKTNVLILGESGTGKELVARAIHFGSNRANAPFIPINCSAIPHELADSAFFGHVKGAFTGALSNNIGYFEQADGGTLFLDELGDMPLLLQAKLLRVLEDSKIMPVGGTQEKLINVRVVSATHQQLEQRIKNNEFRRDLYFRLSGYVLTLPALRQHKEDIALLVEHFLTLLSQDMGRAKIQISNEAMAILLNYDFPGNIRELKNIIEYALIACEGDTIQTHHLHFISNEFAEIDHLPQVPEASDEEKIIAYCHSYGKINNRECQTLLHVKHHRASYLLKKLHNEGKLVRKGERRWAFYELLE